MKQATVTSPADDMTPETLAFYRDVLEALNAHSLPYVVGGGYAFKYYTGVDRLKKDIDIFIARDDYERISDVLSDAGYHTELTYPHWLAKIHSKGDLIDLVFSSGNGISEVDQAWFDHAVPAHIFGVPTKICPVEEMLWSKAFIMERERFDGADIAHLILARGRQLNWPRLLQRFEPHWRLLLSHLVLFGFIYPAHRDLVPTWVMDELLNQLTEEVYAPSLDDKLCGGTLLSREQYLSDVHQWGYQDARVKPHGNMTEKDTENWTEAIRHQK